MNPKVTPQQVKELRDRTGVGMGKCKEALVQASGNMEEAIDILRKSGMAQAVKKEGRETHEGVIKSLVTDECVALIEVNAETDFVVKNENFQKFVELLVEEVCITRPTSVAEFLVQKYSRDSEMTIDQLRAVTIQTLGENIKIHKLEIFPIKENHSIGVYSHGGGKLVTLVEVSGASDVQDFAKDLAMHIAAESPEYLSSDEVPHRVKEHEREIARAQIKNKPLEITEKIVEGKLHAYYKTVCLLEQNYVKDPNLTVDKFVKTVSCDYGKDLKITQFLRWHVGE
ncbi:MAG: elongation factor Ts [Chlamydiia bacterium]|nr:elongation factor Ts [Chlamydiia bacterium]